MTERLDSLARCRELFLTLAAPAPAALSGRYRAEFVGPAWLRALTPPALVLGGLGGWWGKAFDGRGGAVNIVSRRGKRTERLPMRLVEAPSRLDGKPTVVLRYPRGSPFPWPWVIDELRTLDSRRLLCMTLPAAQGAPRIALPFLLHQD